MWEIPFAKFTTVWICLLFNHLLFTSNKWLNLWSIVFLYSQWRCHLLQHGDALLVTHPLIPYVSHFHGVHHLYMMHLMKSSARLKKQWEQDSTFCSRLGLTHFWLVEIHLIINSVWWLVHRYSVYMIYLTLRLPRSVS